MDPGAAGKGPLLHNRFLLPPGSRLCRTGIIASIGKFQTSAHFWLYILFFIHKSIHMVKYYCKMFFQRQEERVKRMETTSYNRNFSKEELQKEVSFLISQKQEGPYWDFKREWYQKNNELLLDIICMANNTCNHDAYLIIGIDEENGFFARKVAEDKYRKNTENIVTLLRDTNFAGGIRPIVFVETIRYMDADIDVIIIQNSRNTPFYLCDNKKPPLEPYHIYSRIEDTNTPRDKSADPNIVEALWKKRFYLDVCPSQRLEYYLKDRKNWEIPPLGSPEIRYYKYFPEFTMREKDDKEHTGYEIYIFDQTDTRPHWINIFFKYHQTIIEYLQGIDLDGGRCRVVCPDKEDLDLTNDRGLHFFYHFFIKETIRYNLLELYKGENEVRSEFSNAYERFMKTVLIFDSELERHSFIGYVKNHVDDFMKRLHEQNQELPYFLESHRDTFGNYKLEYKESLALKSMFEEYKAHSEK